MAKLQQIQSQKLLQKLELKPKMLQSLQMLAMPLLQLELHIKNELVVNPMLDMTEENNEPDDNGLEDHADLVERSGAEPDDLTPAKEEPAELNNTLDEARELSEILDNWNDYHADNSGYSDEKPGPETYMKAVVDIKQEFIEQLEKHNISEKEYDFCVDLIDSADEYGFLPKDFNIESLAAEYDISPTDAHELHQLVMHLEPAGITAYNIKECLLAQLTEQVPHYELIKNIISNDFDNLIHRRYQLLVGKYQVCMDTITACVDIIAHLDPRPGLRIVNHQVDYIVPDVLIKLVEEEYVVIVNDFNFPRIRLNRKYINMIKSMKTDRDAMNYVRGKINSAKFLIKSMYMRNRTLERVTNAIINHQRGFFYQNTGILEPLTYATIATELQVNESTISRVVKDKYADTPFGVLALKTFFTSSAGKDRNYEAVSRQQVQVLIAQFMEAEDKSTPLSDQELVKMLKQRGISVSRRVVAKYREGMGILNSRLRKV